jgi:hypothetical protein
MLYTFGDSFVATRYGEKPDWAWSSLVATAFNTNEIALGIHASSSQYTFNKFEEYTDKFIEGDIVVIVLTLEQKSNFFSDRPKLNIDWQFQPNIDTYTTEEKLAVELYYKHLYNVDNVIVNTTNFLQSVQEVTVRKQLKTFVFFGFRNSFAINQERFPNIRFANGNLWSEQIKEISDKSLFDFLSYHKFFNDSRLLHFTKDNHRIIADKILSSIYNNDLIDFTIGLNQNIFGWNEFKSSAFNSIG